jgi:hypothetical protein
MRAQRTQKKERSNEHTQKRSAQNLTKAKKEPRRGGKKARAIYFIGMRDASSSTSLPKKKKSSQPNDAQNTSSHFWDVNENEQEGERPIADFKYYDHEFQVLCGFGGVREDAIDSVDGFEVVSASAMIKCPG